MIVVVAVGIQYNTFTLYTEQGVKCLEKLLSIGFFERVQVVVFSVSSNRGSCDNSCNRSSCNNISGMFAVIALVVEVFD